MINVPSDDTALPEMLTHALLQMPAREPDIAGVTSRTVNFVDNSAAEHLRNSGLQRGQKRFDFSCLHYDLTWCIYFLKGIISVLNSS